MKIIFAFFLSLAVATAAQTQVQTQPSPQGNPGEVIVRVVNEPAKPAVSVNAATAREYIEIAEAVGLAMDRGLSSLTDHAEKFSKTDVGHFTMATIAWKIAGKDVLGVAREVFTKAYNTVFAVPLLFFWTVLAIVFYRRQFLPRRVVVEKKGMLWWAEKKYQVVNEDKGWGDGKIGAAFVTAAVYIIIASFLVFKFIF